MKSLNEYISESQICEGMTHKQYLELLTRQQHERVNAIEKEYNNESLKDFFKNIKSFKGADYQNPMKNNSIYVSMGSKDEYSEGFFYHYANIFVQFNSPKEKYAIYFNDDKIAICKEMKISYSGQNKDKGSFLQDDGTYGKVSTEMTWLDQSSEAVQNELAKFKL